MKSLFETNGLIFFDEDEIRQREYLRDRFFRGLKDTLLNENPAWSFYFFEAPILTPRNLINQNYTEEDVFVQPPKTIRYWREVDNDYGQPMPVYEKETLVLRPETTPGSYHYAEHLLNTHSGVKPPFCVWQMGKSFRREQDQPSKFCRFKEFYQLEFQCIYTADSMNDYHTAVINPVSDMISETVGNVRVVESDRLPSYSEITTDIEAFMSDDDRWMEVCSISRRTDFPSKAKFQTKKGMVEKDLMVVEVAIGMDRITYSSKA